MIIEQNTQGYRYSIEPFLLADFVALVAGDRVLDIGTGCGIIPLLLICRESRLRITAVEIQKSLHGMASENVARNKLSGQIQVLNGDFTTLAPSLGKELFDLVLSNPPYRKINTGRTNPSEEKAIARHEISLNLASILKESACLLKPEGKIALAYPPLRLAEVLAQMNAYELFPSRLRFIHGSRGADAKIFLVEGVKGRKTDCIVENPLYVYQKDNVYTEEMERIYASFNHTDRPDHIEKERHGGCVG